MLVSYTVAKWLPSLDALANKLPPAFGLEKTDGVVGGLESETEDLLDSLCVLINEAKLLPELDEVANKLPSPDFGCDVKDGLLGAVLDLLDTSFTLEKLLLVFDELVKSGLPAMVLGKLLGATKGLLE